ncbi:UDP-N-acetylmuramoyl-L-alanyl-D-glutamate--2, 6-diaminopimelate ligase [Gammaproteobacteria bacterium]
MIISLNELLDGVVLLPADCNPGVSGLALDSRRVLTGDLFFARSGSHTHGSHFIDEAIARGAVAVVTEGKTIFYSRRQGVPIVSLTDLSFHLGRISACFHGNPSRSFTTIIGVTGTNGKTSTTHLLAQILNRDDAPCAVIGTLGVGLHGQFTPTNHTTPDAVTLQGILADLVTRGARQLVMEVSSHALDQGRVEGIIFNVAVFTNLTRDHLDYHGNLEAYGLAKQRLFRIPGLEYAVINTDDAFGRVLLERLPPSIQAVGYGLSPSVTSCQQYVQGKELSLLTTGLSMEVATPWGTGMLESSLLGRFNALNLLAALATLGVLGMPLDEALLALSVVRTVAGRMERLGGGPTMPLVVVDYAHTPDALEQVLLTLREHTAVDCRLWCVFGCGGERDPGKRPLMGAVTERIADKVIVTNDNPRGDSQDDIFRTILNGMNDPNQAIVIPDRRLAIQHAVEYARPGDVVLVAGKGHEGYQQIGTDLLPFSDHFEVQQALNFHRRKSSHG